MLGLSRAGRTVVDSYYNAVVKYVKDNIDRNGRLHETKSTDNSRLILALTAIGKNVNDVGGYNLLSGLNSMDYIGKQGINGVFWALIAFDSHDYETPTGDVTRDNLVKTILAAQTSDGGWSLSGTTGDADMTGMALQALAPYYNTDSAVKAAVDKALNWLSTIQNKDGSFSGSEGTTSESLAQVITGLTALGINPETDTRFIKNGVSVVDALSKFYVEGGGFKHGLTGVRNMMATEQGYYALVSYDRLLKDKTSLYDMSDVTIIRNKYQVTQNANSTWQQSGGNLIVKSNADFKKFVGVKVDGVLIDSEKYTAAAGSTVITFKANYLKTLSLGTHAISIVSMDGEASTTLTIARSDADEAKLVVDLINAIGTVTKDSGAKIKAARDAYNKLNDAQRALVTNFSTLTAAESTYENLVNTITVYFTLLGDSNHGDNGSIHTYAGGGLSTWISKTSCTVSKGSSVWDVFQKMVSGRYSYTNSGNYISSINGLSEFSNGTYSGWMYTLNGIHSGLGVEEQTVQNGDEIVFHYTDDYRKERGESSGSSGTDTSVQEVIRLIQQIGTVTLNKEYAIKQARAAYDKLSAAEKAQIHNYSVLTEAEEKLSKLQIQDAINEINAIGTVTLGSGNKIDAAWNVYNTLTVEQRAKVTNFSKLVKAQDTYNALRAKETEMLIDEIDETVTLNSEKAILAARKSYNALTETQKKLVDKEHLDKLKAAELALANLKATDNDKKKAEKVMEQIDKLGTITLDSEEAILAARKAYDKLTDIQKALVTNYGILEAAEKKLEELKQMKTLEDIYTSTGDYLENLGIPTVGSVGGEWMVIGLTRSGRQISNAEAYYEAVVQFVRENADEQERLHPAKSTENSRIILALTALGKDVTDVDGHNLLKGLNDMEYLYKQGINGPIWALLALDSGNYPVPEGNVTRAALIDTILAAQNANSGWALSGDSVDPDLTGMAVQALAPYCKEHADVKNAVENAVNALSLLQNADGSYSSVDGTSSESLAQVVTALAALGIDADTDARFVKNSVSVLDVMLTYYIPGGGFCHIPQGNLDGMATEQVFYALVAYNRMKQNQTFLYDMTDVIDMGGDVFTSGNNAAKAGDVVPAEEMQNEKSSVLWVAISVVCMVAATAVLVINRKRLFKF